MADATLAPAAANYLAQLEAALAAVDGTTRDEILAGVGEELVGLDAADAATRIRELGDPEFIAAEARGAAPAQVLAAASITEMRPQSRREPAWFSVVAGLLVMIGGVIVPVVGAVAGYVMVWFSTAWTRRQKIVATAIPLVYIVVLIVGALLASSPGPQAVAANEGSRSGNFSAPASSDFTEQATHSAQNPLLPASYDLIWSGILLLAVVQLGVGIWLLVIARRNWVVRG